MRSRKRPPILPTFILYPLSFPAPLPAAPASPTLRICRRTKKNCTRNISLIITRTPIIAGTAALPRTPTRTTIPCAATLSGWNCNRRSRDAPRVVLRRRRLLHQPGGGVDARSAVRRPVPSTRSASSPQTTCSTCSASAERPTGRSAACCRGGCSRRPFIRPSARPANGNTPLPFGRGAGGEGRRVLSRLKQGSGRNGGYLNAAA